ncbi:MAG TPA: hypothetical protein PKX99_01850, partial [Thermoanaerobaculia bacterium]|nr:hypothetical protein [Thermoanaerobaculia bacterium]
MPAQEGVTPAALLGAGQVAWESNRTGEFRIFLRDLAAAEPRQLSPDEPDRDHCCPLFSPDGSRLVYLSLPAGRAGYEDGRATGELRLVELATGATRTLAPRARTYAEHRAAVWWGNEAVVLIDGEGYTVRLDLASGDHERLTAESRAEFGWLIDPTGRFATTGDPTFSRYDAATRRIETAPRLGGCQPVFSQDRRWGVWSAGAGGPIARLDLESRRQTTLLARNDPRTIDGFGYLYFPNPTRDGAALAFAASRGEHDHFTTDYEIFAVATDPETLEPVGPVVRLTDDPAVDRFPDLWLASPPPGHRAGETGARRPAPQAASTPLPAERWPVSEEALRLLWPDADTVGRGWREGEPFAAADLFAPEGWSWFDGSGRMALAGGRFTLAPALAGELNGELMATNELTLELAIEPWSVASGSGGPIVALANAP